MKRRPSRPILLAVVLLFVAVLPVAASGTCRQTDVYPEALIGPTRHLTILAFGTSLMWGNGLRPKETLRHQITDWLANQTRQPVQLITYAHSGALLTSASAPSSTDPDQVIGIINQSLPSVDEQVACAVQDHLTDASLILVEGCINDVGAEDIVYPWTDSTTIENKTNSWCGRMTDTLSTIEQNFPAAHVLVLGYYPIVSYDTPVLGWLSIPRLARHAGKIYEARHPEARALLKPKRSRHEIQGIAADNSEIFYQRSKAQLQAAVAARQASSPGRFAFAGLPEVRDSDGILTVDPSFAFGAHNRHQWLIPIRILPFWAIFKDHTYWPRQKICRQYAARGVDELVCDSNPAAHPNLAGEALYIQSIKNALPPDLLATWAHPSTPATILARNQP